MPRNPFRRSVPVPSDVLSAAQVRGEGKILAAAIARDGTWLLGTGRALHLVEPGRVVEPVETTPSGAHTLSRRVPWEEVERADWERDQGRLSVVEVGEFGKVRPRHVYAVDEPGTLLELIRERVTASVVLQRRVPISGKRGLSVVARRAPHGDGEVTWAYEFDPDVDPEDPGVMEAAQRGLEAARAELGL